MRSYCWLIFALILLHAFTGKAAAPPKTATKPREIPPLTLYPACPCYHIAGTENGRTRVDCSIAVPRTARTGLHLVLDLAHEGGNTIQTAAVDASKSDLVGCELSVPVQQPGSFKITARLMDRSGKQLAKAETDVEVIARDESRVELGPDGLLRIKGQPNFPIGMYSAGHYEEMGKAGFTATHSYAITTGEANDLINPTDAHLKQLLDNTAANGMRMMVELPRKAIEKAQWPQVRRRIETFRHHPGLLCWGSEERVARGLTRLTNIVTLYHLVHELDPDHPLVLGDTKDVIQKFKDDRRDFFPDQAMDVGIWWWYPIPLKDLDGNGLDGREKSNGLLNPPKWLTTTISKKPLWIAIQAYEHKTKDGRYPTPEEYRCMAYVSIINGVKGLFFYTGSGQKDIEGKPAGLLNKLSESHWDYVQKLARELRELSPVFMAPPSKSKLSVSPPDSPLEFTTRELEGKVFLIAANKSMRQQTARFSGPAIAGKRAVVLYETHPVAVQGDSLADEFGPLGVHVYRLE